MNNQGLFGDGNSEKVFITYERLGRFYQMIGRHKEITFWMKNNFGVVIGTIEENNTNKKVFIMEFKPRSQMQSGVKASNKDLQADYVYLINEFRNQKITTNVYLMIAKNGFTLTSNKIKSQAWTNIWNSVTKALKKSTDCNIDIINQITGKTIIENFNLEHPDYSVEQAENTDNVLKLMTTISETEKEENVN